jgi:hypothetical protein
MAPKETLTNGQIINEIIRLNPNATFAVLKKNTPMDINSYPKVGQTSGYRCTQLRGTQKSHRRT